MILGVGVDIVKVERFVKIAEDKKSRFMQRVYTTNEANYLSNKNPESYAGIFAAKEAVVKAMGTGFKGFFPNQVEILYDKNGKPYVVLHEKAKKAMEKSHCLMCQFQLSISHTESDAIAFVILSIPQTS